MVFILKGDGDMGEKRGGNAGPETRPIEDVYPTDEPTTELARAAFARQTGEARHADVMACQRCGRDHDGLRFRQLTNAVDEWQWWAMCPATGEPILMKVAQERAG